MVRVVLPIKRESYRLVEKISKKLGMEPSAWINLVVTNKLKAMCQESLVDCGDLD
jgi:hypothetical protein